MNNLSSIASHFATEIMRFVTQIPYCVAVFLHTTVQYIVFSDFMTKYERNFITDVQLLNTELCAFVDVSLIHIPLSTFPQKHSTVVCYSTVHALLIQEAAIYGRWRE